MKKIIISLALIITIFCINKSNEVIIPKEAIRFRIIASSNSRKDQNLKKEIVRELEKDLVNKNFKDIKGARNYFKNNIEEFTNIVDKKLIETSSNRKFHINYGKNYFPEKKYQNVTYPEGNYESLVITLGDGKGKNFWCVLFPPLCLIDEKENEYPSLIKGFIDKYF